MSGSKPARGAIATLLERLPGASASEAALAVARPDAAMAREIERLRLDPARAVVDVYEALAVGPEQRKREGVYYTPPAVVGAMLDRVPLDGLVLDPAAGAGAFVLELIRRLGADALERVHASDRDGEALGACALALEALTGRRSEAERWRERNAQVLDFLREFPSAPPDLIVGNPPYGLDGAPDLERLFPDLRGELDLYACFLLRAARVVTEAGTVALLVPDTWLTNRRADGLRRALASRGLTRIVDFGKPFAGAKDTRVHAVVLRRGARKCEVEATRDGRIVPMAPADGATLLRDSERGWFLYRTTAEARAIATMERGARRLGDAFEVLYGLRTGSNAQHVREEDGGVRLVGGGDLAAYDRTWQPKSLVDPEGYASPLARQAGRWKVGVQRIRTNSRISWRRWVEAAPVRPDEVGLDSLTLAAEKGPASEGDELPPALCALLGVLNSSILNRWYRLTFTDVNVKPAYVEVLPLPVLQSDLAALVQRRLASPGDLALERAIDRLVAQAYGMSDAETAVLEEGFWGADLAARPMPSLEEARRLAGAPPSELALPAAGPEPRQKTLALFGQ